MSHAMLDEHSSAGKVGTVYLVGAGPGAPGLITVRGLELIRRADVIVYDYLAGEWFSQEVRQDAELIYVGKKGSDHTLEQTDINDLIVAKAREGKSVVRLKGGDPYVFGRGGEEAEDLVSAGIPFEVVPGVTSAVAAPAYAGIPVTHRDHASLVTFITGHENSNKRMSSIDWENLAHNPGTLVFLMGVKNLSHISGSLMDHGMDPNTPAALVRWGTTPKQGSFATTLREIAAEADRRHMKAPAVLIVGAVAQLHDKLSWFEKMPLFGKRIIITRTRAQSTRMADAISELGGDPILFPTIVIGPPDDFSGLDASIRKAGSFDWIIFTSVNGVEKFFERFFQIQDDIRSLAGPRIAAIGPMTAQVLHKRGMRVDVLAKEFVAEGVLAQFPEHKVRGKRFLIPRAQEAREILPEGLAEMGGQVTVVATYKTGIPADSDVATVRRLLQEGKVDAVTFTSSSTVRHFARMLDEPDLAKLLDATIVASIGPVTSETIRDMGFPVHVEASKFTVEGLVNALVEHFRTLKD